MKKSSTLILILILASSLTAGASFGKSFKVDLTVHKDGDVDIHDFSITRTERSPEQSGNYSLSLEDNANQTLYKYEFSPEFQTSGHTIGSGDQLNETGSKAQERRMSFWIPYNKSATKIVGRHKGETVVKKSLTKKLCQNFDGTCSSYCDGKGIDVDCTCGNDICQESTNEKELCPQDCSDTGSEEPEEENTEPNKTKKDQTKEIVDNKYSNYLLILIIVATVLVGLFLLSGKVQIEA